jgi:hypothetical protein
MRRSQLEAAAAVGAAEARAAETPREAGEPRRRDELSVGDRVRLRRATVTFPEGADGFVLGFYRGTDRTEAAVSFVSRPPGVFALEELERVRSSKRAPRELPPAPRAVTRSPSGRSQG